MLNWDNITKLMEFQFVTHTTPYVAKRQVLWEAIKWISNHLKPEDVFSENRLIEWWERAKYRINPQEFSLDTQSYLGKEALNETEERKDI